MPAAERLRRVGFPTTRLLAVAVALTLGAAPPTGAALLAPALGPPVGFESEVSPSGRSWHLLVPALPGMQAVTFGRSDGG